MRKLSLSILAAGAATLSTAAIAQPAPPPGHGMPGGMMMRQMGPMAGQYFQHRLQRGFVVPRFFWGPQFQVQNWQMYGFSDPGPDGRWIRYYDDAYLIDHDGRIRDSREGLDWDRYGEEWDMADGIPAYRGRHERRGEEGEWAEEHERHGEHMRGEMREMHMRQGGPPMGPGYGGAYTQVYGGGGGYGAYAYPIVIETVTTTGGGQSYSEEVVEEYRTVHRARHHVRPRCLCQAPRTIVRYVRVPVPVHHAPPPRPVRHAPPPRPRPPAGERG